MTDRIDRFLRENRPELPCLVVDLDLVENHYVELAHHLPGVEIFYAMKANPALEVLKRLMPLGCHFDAASIYEVSRCITSGISPSMISFGNTAKKESAIRAAAEYGVSLFAFDCEAELEKIARSAPGATVFCRLLTSGDGADWPLSDKFGCPALRVPDLLRKAADLGLKPGGVSFHVGSQQRDISQWGTAIESVADVFDKCAALGLEPDILNIGGGFPSRYREETPPLSDICGAITESIKNCFGKRKLRVIAEPGRYIPGDAGLIETEVVLVSRKAPDDPVRWVYIDTGVFGGLIETLGEAIRYRIETDYDGVPTGPVVLAGPTCDEVDVMYEDTPYELPLDLKPGDRLRIMSTGAYTASYSSVGFNGFPPLREYYI